MGYKLGNVPFDANFRPVVSGGIGWGDPFSWTGSVIRKTVQVPATITNTTPQVLIRGELKKPENDAGGALCVETFIGSYVKNE
jgi:hypothetical protein